MSHGKLRTEKNCLNCGNIVEEKFCPHCGQENTEPKQPFHSLFTHFVEDFTHYDGQFWKTIKYLLFRPGKLTNEYLAGKRQQYVVPVKLYIFISFITFFLFSLYSPVSTDQVFNDGVVNNEAKKNMANELKSDEVLGQINAIKPLGKEDSLALLKVQNSVKDSAKVDELIEETDMNSKLSESSAYRGFKTKSEYDKYQKLHPSWLNRFDRPFAYKFFELKKMEISKKEIFIKFFEIAFHNLPKALFIYLPIFAFFLWLFHNKKMWWYFDHGIFTLHYFSFLLLIITIMWLTGKVFNLLPDNGFVNLIQTLGGFVITIYALIYFFLAHHRVYHARKKFSVFIGVILFFINFFAFSFLLVGLMALSFLMLK